MTEDWADKKAEEALYEIMGCTCGICIKRIAHHLREAEARGMKRASEALTFKEGK